MLRGLCHRRAPQRVMTASCSFFVTTTANTTTSLRLIRCTPSALPPTTLSHAVRHRSYVTNASSFETEVIQSQQAICLIYHIPNSNCSAYLKAAEKLVEEINAQTAGIEGSAVVPTATPSAAQTDRTAAEDLCVEAAAGTQATGDTSGSAPSPSAATTPAQRQSKVEWLKLCTINADENRNLASAFSVERAKLPITYFVMQGTIVDKVVGHIAEARLRGILIKFLEHYQKELNIDLLARHAKVSGGTGSASPLPAAATADLLSGTSTNFMQDKLMNALVGADMIRLPEEAEKLDGLRRTLQDAKKQAHAELQELHKQLGIDVRRLTEAEMQAHYFNASQFRALGVLCALEALYLARTHATLGDIAHENVEWARRAVQKDFEPIQGDPVLRRVLALVDVNLVRGELRTAAMLAAQDANRLQGTLSAMDADAPGTAAHREALQAMLVFVEGQRQYCLDMLGVVDAYIDTRTLEGSDFPSAVVDGLFEALKNNMKLGRTRLPSRTSPSSSAPTAAAVGAEGDREEALLVQNLVEGKVLDTTVKRVLTAQARVPQLRTLIMSLLQLYPTDPKSQDARSRLASLMY